MTTAYANGSAAQLRGPKALHILADNPSRRPSWPLSWK